MKSGKSTTVDEVGEVLAKSSKAGVDKEEKSPKDNAEGRYYAEKALKGSSGTKEPKCSKFAKFKAGKEGNSSKKAKNSKEPIGTMPTTTKSAKGTTTCPSSSKASKLSKGATAAPAVPLNNAWGQVVGTQVVISPLANPTYCFQPKAVAADAGLETVPCTYDAGDAFTIREHGQLVTSDPSLCVTGAGNELVLDTCATSCSVIFQYDDAAFTIQSVVVRINHERRDNRRTVGEGLCTSIFH